MTNEMFDTTVEIRVFLKPKRPPEDKDENMAWSLIEENTNLDAQSLGRSLESYFSLKAYLKFRELRASKKNND